MLEYASNNSVGRPFDEDPQARSLDFATSSKGASVETTEGVTAERRELSEDVPLLPTSVDVNRLKKAKREQEERLKLLKNRINHLTAQENSVWKDVSWTQQMALQAQEASCHRQVQRTAQCEFQQDMLARDKVRRKNTVDLRSKVGEKTSSQRLATFEDRKSSGQQVRHDSQRFAAALEVVREQQLQKKQTQVDAQRQKRRQQQIKRETELARQEQARMDLNISKFSQMQEEMQNVEYALAGAEREELTALSRLQHSRSVRSESVMHLHTVQGLSVQGGSDVGDESFDAYHMAHKAMDSTLDGSDGVHLSVHSASFPYLPTVDESPANSPVRSQSLSARSNPTFMSGSSSAPHLHTIVTANGPLSARGPPRGRRGLNSAGGLGSREPRHAG